MKMHLLPAQLFVTLTAWSFYGVAAVLPPDQLGLKIASCTIGIENYVARCGTFTVYEDRAASSGRTIALPIVVLPAKHPSFGIPVVRAPAQRSLRRSLQRGCLQKN
jgi:hypothetical protein